MSAEAERRTETVPEWKRDEVDELVAFIQGYQSVGIVDVTGIPSRQLQAMRAELHGDAAVRMSRNTLLERALTDVDEGVEALTAYVDGQVGLIGTNENPFGLYRQLEASKTAAPINAGETAPNDIVIPEGDTGMDPGPFVGELQNVGAAAQIMEGSIRVTEDSVVCEAGEEVSDDLANVLSELGIEPKEVGLDLRAVFSDGIVFEADELAIDIDDYRADFEAATARGWNLAINATYPTARTLPSLIGRASADAKSVGLFAAVESPGLATELVSRADAQVRALAARIDDPDALPEELGDIEAPAAPATPEQPTDESGQDTDETEAETDTETEAEPTDDEPEDEEVSGEGLGDLFG